MTIWSRASRVALFAGAFGAANAIGCSSSTDDESSKGSGAASSQSTASGPTASGGAGGAGATSAGGMGGSTYPNGGGPPTNLAPCGGKIYECGDLVDNDMDCLLYTSPSPRDS